MKRPKYRDYERRILEYLITKTFDGECLRLQLQSKCKIPKSSMSNVLSDMENQALIARHDWFGRQEKIVITDSGRRLYSDIIAKPAVYGLPYQVQNYLNKRVPKITKLHTFQEDFVNRGLLHARDNVCVFTYPASGKTLLAEMAMVQTISNGGKALYCTPYKALDWQKYADFTQSFSQLGAKVVVTDGDNPVRLNELESADVVIGTYERIIGAVRRGENWLSQISLLCADEITLLADEERGSIIDLLLTLMKGSKKNMRIITLSSVVGNALDISQWLNAKPIIENRPLPGIVLEESVVYKDGNQLFFLSKDGNERSEVSDTSAITHLVKKNLSSGKTTLIFVGPRDTTRDIAEDVNELHKQDHELTKRVEEFTRSSYFENTELTSELCELLKFGVAFHHAGLHKRVRRFVEKLLSEGKLKTIVATTTLSHGIDYKIDSVIISYRSVESVHPLHCYEYINYKGRSGRFGKSAAACTYIVCDKSEAQEIFSKLFLGEPEEIVPKNPFEGEEVATMALAAAASGDVTSSEARLVAEGGLWATSRGGKIPLFTHVLTRLCAAGFMAKKDGRYVLTRLGRMTNESNLSPYDIGHILKLGSNPSAKELIATATKIDLVRRYRGYRGNGVRSGDPTSMLLDWIQEMPIDDIRRKYRHYDDGDILLLGEYTAISLQKISAFAKDKRTKKLINMLIERLRCGVKQDVARGGFTKLTAIARDKARPLARAFIKNDYRNLAQLSKATPSELSKRLAISEAQATSILTDCQRSLQ